MDSSENDEAMETPTSPSEPEPERIEPADAPMDLADAEGFPPDAPQARVDERVPEESSAKEDAFPAEDPLRQPGNRLPVEPAEPGMYYCDDDDPGVHTQLATLYHGENNFTGLTHPEELQALGELVAAGVLRKA